LKQNSGSQYEKGYADGFMSFPFRFAFSRVIFPLCLKAPNQNPARSKL
jgi:hypothetical protein